MAEVTGIAWTDSTFNPWIGCTKVSPGCDHCYAEALDKRHRWQGDTHWGPGKPRMRTSAANWAKPRAWNKARQKDGKTHRVFCASLADVFDNEVPTEWRHDLFNLIWETPALTWLLLTKRIGNAKHMLPLTLLPNAWIGATIVNAEEAERDVPKLLETPAAVRFVSYEPALGPVDWTKYPGIDWIIVGGESGHNARNFDVHWARTTITQAREIGAAVFVKQMGYHAFNDWEQGMLGKGVPVEDASLYYRLKDAAGADPDEWPASLRVREFPSCSPTSTRKA